MLAALGLEAEQSTSSGSSSKLPTDSSGCGQSETFKRDRQDSSGVERSAPSRLSRKGGKPNGGIATRAQSARHGLAEVRDALAHATQHAGTALNDLDELAGKLGADTTAAAGGSSSSVLGSCETAYGAALPPKDACGTSDDRLDLILAHLESMQDRLDRLEEHSREHSRSSGQGPSKTRFHEQGGSRTGTPPRLTATRLVLIACREGAWYHGVASCW